MNNSIAANTLTLDGVRPGVVLPVLRYEVTATTVVHGALATRDWRPMHHDHDFAVNRNGTQDIFLNTPNQAAWFERYLTDWSGPRGRLGRMKFRMKGSVFPGDTMVLAGTVEHTELDLIRLMLPSAYGGSDMTALEGAVVYMELGRALATTPHFVSAVMGAGVLLRAGSEEQKPEWLPRIVTGDALLTTAWLEPGGG